VMDRVMIHPPGAGMARSPAPVRANGLVLFFYRRYPQWFMPKRICAWCDHLIARGGIFSRGKISHGVCALCSAEALEQSWIARAIGSSAGAVFFLAAILLSSCTKRSEEQAAVARVYRPMVHQAVTLPPAERPSLEVRP
jgi:hypothetical protein